MNMNDAIIEVLSHVAGWVWNIYTRQCGYNDKKIVAEYNIGEVMKHCFQSKVYGVLSFDTKKKERTWLFDTDLNVYDTVRININNEWKMEFEVCEVFYILDKFCKLDGKKHDIRFRTDTTAPTAIRVADDDPYDTRKWRLNGTLLSELDMGTINHRDLAPMKSYKVREKGQTYTVPYARALPRKVSGYGIWLFFFFPETSMVMSAKHDSCVA